MKGLMKRTRNGSGRAGREYLKTPSGRGVARGSFSQCSQPDVAVAQFIRTEGLVGCFSGGTKLFGKAKLCLAQMFEGISPT